VALKRSSSRRSPIHAEGRPRRNEARTDRLDRREHAGIFICTRDAVYDKVMNNMMEVRARRGHHRDATEGDEAVRSRRSRPYVPPTVPCLQSLPGHSAPAAAYHTAVLRGCDVDQPRNLAKSVTVE
jgi:glucosamine--fructose-6-phosphate aminotransferase (isomerizing)